MRRSLFLRDQRATSAVEFAIMAPAFLLLMTGIAQVSIWLWSGLALQHGVELAARCATFNPTSCADAASVKTYAAAQSYGLTVSSSAFTFTKSTCGNQVSASLATANFLRPIGVPDFTATATACFPA